MTSLSAAFNDGSELVDKQLSNKPDSCCEAATVAFKSTWHHKHNKLAMNTSAQCAAVLQPIVIHEIADIGMQYSTVTNSQSFLY